tara:strand:+ start:959 stop:2179 length:1221 start_codon:yes stop_codon:yes gene_type:complete
MLSLKNILNNFFLFFLIVSSAFGQDFNLKIQTQIFTNLENSFFLNNYNYGIEREEFDTDIFINFKSKKFELQFNPLINQDIIKESFFRYNFNDSSFIRIGKYYSDFSPYFNHELSSGHMLISNNSPPMKKVGFFKSKSVKKITLDFGISHGIFNKNDLYQKAPFLHEKFIYMGIPLRDNYLGIGFIHEAMWGGESKSRGAFPSGFDNFLKVLIAADEPLRDGQPHANAIGNHLGIWEFVYQKLSNKNTLKFYYQHFFEDTSGLRFANKYDGLWGFELNDKITKNTFLLEYLETTNQNINPPYVDDAYYNHGDYSYGWSLDRFTLGNPHINSLEVNPVKVIHFGSKLYFGQNISAKLLFSKKINIDSETNFLFKINKSYKKSFSNSLVLYNTSGGYGLGFIFVLTLK